MAKTVAQQVRDRLGEGGRYTFDSLYGEVRWVRVYPCGATSDERQEEASNSQSALRKILAWEAEADFADRASHDCSICFPSGAGEREGA